MKKLDQNGFHALLVIIIIAVVAVIGGGGWYLYQKNQTKTAQDVADNAQVNDDGGGSAQDGYLAIPELGIQLKLADGVKDATYSVMADGSTYGVSTQSLASQFGSNCSAASGNVAQVAVFVSSNGPNFGTGSKDISAYPGAFKSADGVYYALNYAPIQETFCGDAATNQQAADSLQKQVTEGFSKTKVEQLQ